MDIETEGGESVRQAAAEDLERVLAVGFGGELRLVRNYGDRLEARAVDAESYCIRFYDASSGLWHQADGVVTRPQVDAAFRDYFLGNWNWHGGQRWHLAGVGG
jgi:hypothetical protein